MNTTMNSRYPNNCSGRVMPVQQFGQPVQPMPGNGRTTPAPVSDGAGPMNLTPPPTGTPTTVESPYYIAGLLTQYVGERIRAQFLVGTTGPLVDITGTLLQVGANYIIIQPVETDDLMVCDLYSIKFVTVFR